MNEVESLDKSEQFDSALFVFQPIGYVTHVVDNLQSTVTY